MIIHSNDTRTTNADPLVFRRVVSRKIIIQSFFFHADVGFGCTSARSRLTLPTPISLFLIIGIAIVVFIFEWVEFGHLLPFPEPKVFLIDIANVRRNFFSVFKRFSLVLWQFEEFEKLTLDHRQLLGDWFFFHFIFVAHRFPLLVTQLIVPLFLFQIKLFHHVSVINLLLLLFELILGCIDGTQLRCHTLLLYLFYFLIIILKIFFFVRFIVVLIITVNVLIQIIREIVSLQSTFRFLFFFLFQLCNLQIWQYQLLKRSNIRKRVFLCIRPRMLQIHTIHVFLTTATRIQRNVEIFRIAVLGTNLRCHRQKYGTATTTTRQWISVRIKLAFGRYLRVFVHDESVAPYTNCTSTTTSSARSGAPFPFVSEDFHRASATTTQRVLVLFLSVFSCVSVVWKCLLGIDIQVLQRLVSTRLITEEPRMVASLTIVRIIVFVLLLLLLCQLRDRIASMRQKIVVRFEWYIVRHCRVRKKAPSSTTVTCCLLRNKTTTTSTTTTVHFPDVLKVLVLRHIISAPAFGGIRGTSSAIATYKHGTTTSVAKAHSIWFTTAPLAFAIDADSGVLFQDDLLIALDEQHSAVLLGRTPRLHRQRAILAHNHFGELVQKVRLERGDAVFAHNQHTVLAFSLRVNGSTHVIIALDPQIELPVEDLYVSGTESHVLFQNVVVEMHPVERVSPSFVHHPFVEHLQVPCFEQRVAVNVEEFLHRVQLLVIRVVVSMTLEFLIFNLMLSVIVVKLLRLSDNLLVLFDLLHVVAAVDHVPLLQLKFVQLIIHLDNVVDAFLKLCSVTAQHMQRIFTAQRLLNEVDFFVVSNTFIA
mmetsp:Transcript_59932/g.98916  ORF Transcript_59932/g.98916 Transcript_59932/m.98916 type:complete len:815 (-) Transcript_59932:2802-5246(-)